MLRLKAGTLADLLKENEGDPFRQGQQSHFPRDHGGVALTRPRRARRARIPGGYLLSLEVSYHRAG